MQAFVRRGLAEMDYGCQHGDLGLRISVMALESDATNTEIYQKRKLNVTRMLVAFLEMVDVNFTCTDEHLGRCLKEMGMLPTLHNIVKDTGGAKGLHDIIEREIQSRGIPTMSGPDARAPAPATPASWTYV